MKETCYSPSLYPENARLPCLHISISTKPCLTEAREEGSETPAFEPWQTLAVLQEWLTFFLKSRRSWTNRRFVIGGRFSVARMELPLNMSLKLPPSLLPAWGAVVVTRRRKWLKQNQPLSNSPLCACLRGCLGWELKDYITWQQLFRLLWEPTISATACWE